MHASLALVLAAASFATAHNVVSLDIHKPQQSARDRRVRRLGRRQTINEPLTNGGNLYYANITVGTPTQSLALQIDTGSSDVWMTASTADFCQDYTNAAECSGGTFDYKSSSSFKVVNQDFAIQYVDQTYSQGDFFTDNLGIGPSSSQVTITGQQMGLATDTTIGTGIIGVGFASDESVCAQTFGTCNTYPSVMQMLVSQKKINSQAYSLWLNDLEANTGSILFGGIDTDKYSGQLMTLPIQPDADSKSITSFTIAWTNLTLGTSSGVGTQFVSSGFTAPAILDSGTTLTLVPDDVAEKMLYEFGAEQDSSGIFIAPCSLASSTATFDFQFGGASGPIIRVPISEFLLPAQPENSILSGLGFGFTMSNGDAACEVGLQAAGDAPILFGDTFLRSAYVVYDLDNQEISLAQTNFNSTTSNIQEIQAGSKGVPDVSTTVTGVVAAQSATSVANLGDLGQGTRSAGRESITFAFTSGTAAPLAQYTAPNSFNPQPAAGSSTAGATGVRAAGILKGEGFILGSLLAAAAAVGGALIML